MFWSGNFIVVRELNFLLKEENVTLSQVLEADDILQECKADNKALSKFLTRPDILEELITLITEEPPQNVELSQQYGHANMACEVLTSSLSSLSEKLSENTAQMNRLCDFINKDPPLNPLLASYFSKTIEMLLERSPKQDWYLYHIVCLRVLDFFKSRRDFLPNLLRHISTSAIADIFKCFIRLDDLFNKTVMEWLEEHQFLESLIQIICGTYAAAAPDEPEKGQRDTAEKENHGGGGTDDDDAQGTQDSQNNPVTAEEAMAAAAARRRVAARAAAVASANAASLLCDLVATGCAHDGAAARSRTSWVLVSRLAGAGGVRALLQGVFTSSGAARAHAIVNGCRLLLALLTNHPVLGAEGAAERSQVELAVAPHLPLLHQALLHHPCRDEEGANGAETCEGRAGGAGECDGRVGAARVHTAALLAHLALSEVEEVPTTMLTLGTPGVLADMFFRYPHNNFLHAQLVALCRNALSNAAYRTQYARHLLVECDLLTRMMDAFEENENKQGSSPRAGYMGHVTLFLSCVERALAGAGGGALAALLPPPLARRWAAFRAAALYPALQHLDTPLGGTHPTEDSYEADEITDRLEENYDFSYAMATAGRMDEIDDDLTNDNDMGHPGTHADSAEFIADGLGLDSEDPKMNTAKSNFLELASQRFDDDMWDEAPEPEQPAAAADVLAWDEESRPAETLAGEGWARFEPPAAPFADPFAPYWPYGGAPDDAADQVSEGVSSLSLEPSPLSQLHAVSLATNLLTAMSAMSPQALANLVNANLEPLPTPTADPTTADADHAADADSAGEAGSADATSSFTGSLGSSTDAPVNFTGSPTNSTDAPANFTGSPTNSINAPVNFTGSPASSTDVPANCAGSPAHSAILPLSYSEALTNSAGSSTKLTNSPADLTGSPVISTNSRVDPMNSPPKFTGSPANSTDWPANFTSLPFDDTGSPAKVPNSPQSTSFPSDANTTLTNVTEPQNVPSAFEPTFPVDTFTTTDKLSLENASPAESNSPPRENDTKDFDKAERVNDISAVNQTSSDTSSPTKSPPNSEVSEETSKVLEAEPSER